MISEREFWNIYAEYAQIETAITEKIQAFIKKNPTAKPEIEKQTDFLNKIIFLKETFHKQYHYMFTISGKNSEFYAERKRLLEKIARIEIENSKLKEEISRIMS